MSSNLPAFSARKISKFNPKKIKEVILRQTEPPSEKNLPLKAVSKNKPLRKITTLKSSQTPPTPPTKKSWEEDIEDINPDEIVERAVKRGIQARAKGSFPIEQPRLIDITQENVSEKRPKRPRTEITLPEEIIKSPPKSSEEPLIEKTPILDVEDDEIYSQYIIADEEDIDEGIIHFGY